MSSNIRNGWTFHGISVFGRGVFTGDEYGWIYAGQIRDGYACGLGVHTWSDGSKDYAEHGPDGQFDGRNLDRNAAGDTFYRLFERGMPKDDASVCTDGQTGATTDSHQPSWITRLLDGEHATSTVARATIAVCMPRGICIRPPLRDGISHGGPTGAVG